MIGVKSDDLLTAITFNNEIGQDQIADQSGDQGGVGVNSPNSPGERPITQAQFTQQKGSSQNAALGS